MLTYISNIFFSETTRGILAKHHRNDPGMARFRKSPKNLIPVKILLTMATKLKNIEILFKKKSFLSKTVKLRVTKFDM